jgi:hypothetical protein
MQFTASSPQYAFGPNMAPVPMMAGGGLASLPVQRFQSGGITMGGLTAPMGTVMGMNVTPMDVISLVAPPPVSVVNAVVNAYNAFAAKQDPAPIDVAQVDPYSPPPPGIAIGVPETVSVEGISPGYSEPGRAQSVVDAMIAAQQEEQAQAQAEAQAAQAAATVAATADAVDADAGATSAANASGSAMGDSGAGIGGDAGGGGMGANDGPGNDSSATGGADSSASGGAGDAFRYGGRVMNYAQGGLPSLASNMASKGRYGDSMMVHMSPEEVQGLQRLAMADGTSLSINPYTGMPEAFSLKRSLKKLAKFIAPILPFIPIPGLAGLSPLLTKTLLSGAVGGFSGKKGFDLKRALTSGLTTYGIGSLAQAAGAAGNVEAPKPSITSNIDPGALEGMSTAQVADTVGSMPSTAPPTPMEAPSKFVDTMPEGSGFTDYVKQTGENIQTAGRGMYDTLTGAPGAREAFTSGQAINPFTDKPIAASTAATAAAAGVSGTMSLDELDKAKAEADKILQDAANRTEAEKAYARDILRKYPIEYRRITGKDVSDFGLAMGGKINSYDDEIGGDDGMMQGGIAALAKGGLPPRYLRGGGDGMSDSIRANIDGKQEARLADGEFVVPADVVSHLGNGSSNAGARKLYSMMDRVRRSRTGKTRQAPEVNTRSMMPA